MWKTYSIASKNESPLHPVNISLVTVTETVQSPWEHIVLENRERERRAERAEGEGYWGVWKTPKTYIQSRSSSLRRTHYLANYLSGCILKTSNTLSLSFMLSANPGKEQKHKVQGSGLYGQDLNGIKNILCPIMNRTIFLCDPLSARTLDVFAPLHFSCSDLTGMSIQLRGRCSFGLLWNHEDINQVARVRCHWNCMSGGKCVIK